MSHPPLKCGAMIRHKGIPALRKARPPPEGLFCLYPHRTCMQNRLDGYDFCAKHILEDKNSVFKQCNYMSGRTGKRCPCAAPKSDKKEGYCLDHSRRAQLLRQKASRKRRPRETPETLLEQIEHYGTKAEGGREVKRGRPSAESITSRILDYASSTDSESEQQLVEHVWRGDADSDAESIDSEQEDPLKHAGIYTAEEVALITKDKLIRLQSLYIEQFKRLQHVMREKRRKYLHTVKPERETLGSIYAAREDPEQRETYDKLIAMKHYHKRYGREALLHRQSKERRIAASEGSNYKPPSYPKCQQIVGLVRCTARTVPLSKFCTQHILSDPHQILYQTCGYGLGTCERPIAVTESNNYCPAHTKLTPYKKRFPPPADKPLIEDKEATDVVIDTEVKSEVVFKDSRPQETATYVTVVTPIGPIRKQEENRELKVETPSPSITTSANLQLTKPVQHASLPSSRPTSRPPSRQSSKPSSRPGSRPHTPQVPTS